ncbi:PP-loop superfamily ATPase-like protein, partial [Trachipleistophora hominis]
VQNDLFSRGEKVLVAVSGGKDSTVLAHIMDLLNKRHDYGINLHLVCVDEGIKGYRDHSLEMVKQNKKEYNLELEIVSFKEMFELTMDEVMQKKRVGSCTYCGVFRRQALEEGARRIGATKIITGHNADDMAETVVLNLLRGDFNRLKRCTAARTKKNLSDEPNIEDMKKGCGCDESVYSASLVRVKPFKYIYEKEIVFYAYLKNLKYFSTECIYSPGAHREYARMFLRSVEPELIMNVIKSGEFLERSDAGARVWRCVSCGKMTSSAAKRCKACVLLSSLQNLLN